jgi:Ran GTPase-activating protein (RanGAP) involved in mRNA processing and transport
MDYLPVVVSYHSFLDTVVIGPHYRQQQASTQATKSNNIHGLFLVVTHLAMAVLNRIGSFCGATGHDGNHVLMYLESHPEIENLRCEEIVSDDHVQAMDLLLKNYHSAIHLQTLELPRNGLTAAAGASLARIIESQRETLVKLDVSHNPLTAEGLMALLRPLVSDHYPPPSSFPVSQEGVVVGWSSSSSLCLMPPCALTCLDLTMTQLGSKGASSLARLIKHNRTLRELYLGQNGLGKRGIRILAPELVANTSLKVLSIPYNAIGPGGGILATAYHQNSSSSSSSSSLEPSWVLETLDVTSNGIRKGGMDTFRKWLVDDRRLRVLCVGNNGFGQDGAASLAMVLRHNYTLQELSLPGNGIGDDGALVIAKELEGANSTLERIVLSWNDIGPVGASGLAKALTKNAKLTHVDLSSNRMGSEGAKDLADCLLYNLVLEELILNHNEIEDDGAFALAMALGQLTLHRNSGSRAVVLCEDNPFTSEGKASLKRLPRFQRNLMTWLGRLLDAIKNKTVGSINLWEEPIGNEELYLLAKKLGEHRPAIRSLSLGESPLLSLRSLLPLANLALKGPTNTIERLYLQNLKALGDKGAAALGEALVDNPTLAVLVLSDCCITAQGARSITAGLLRNKVLRRLNLDLNAIGDEGCTHLITTVLPHASLTSIHVSYNQLTDAVLELSAIQTLTELNLNGNTGITDQGALRFCLLLSEERNQLKSLSLCQTQITRKGGETLRLHLRPAMVEY